MGQTTTSGLGISQHIPPVVIPPPGPPFAPTSADNGCSVDPVTKRIVLFQDAGAAPGVGAGRLLSTRELDLNGFDLLIGIATGGSPGSVKITADLFVSQGDAFGGGTVIEMMRLDYASFRTTIGDVNGVFGTTRFIVDAGSLDISAYGEMGVQLLKIDTNSNNLTFGDVANNINGVKLAMDIGNNLVTITGSIGGSPAIAMLRLDGANGNYAIGDSQRFANGTAMTIDDTTETIDFSSFTSPNPTLSVNGVPGFTGTVTPVTSITVVGGIVTAVS